MAQDSENIITTTEKLDESILNDEEMYIDVTKVNMNDTMIMMNETLTHLSHLDTNSSSTESRHQTPAAAMVGDLKRLMKGFISSFELSLDTSM